MKLATVGNKLQRVLGRKGLILKKHSPEILMAAGIIGVVGSTVLACKATLRAEELIDEHAEKMEKINLAREKFDEEKYSEREYKQDKVVAYTQTTFNFIKLYGPSVTLGIASIGCILGAHSIMKKRNVALMAAYKLVEQSFAEYRKRVVDELGEDKDFHFRYGTTEVESTETVVDENGKKTKIKKTTQVLDGTPCSMYARLFEPEERNNDGSWTGSGQFSAVHQYNYMFLTQKRDYFNDRLHAVGHVFLNEVYDELGFPHTKAGQEVGWVDGYRDSYISFGPCLEDMFAFHDGDPILLDFNVDGVVLDLIDD